MSTDAAPPVAVAVATALAREGLVPVNRLHHVTQVVSRTLAHAPGPVGGPAAPGAPAKAAAPKSSRLGEVVGYVGAALVMAALALILAKSWQLLSDAARIGVTGGIGVVLVAGAVLLATVVGPYATLRTGGPRRHLVALLLVTAAAAFAGAVEVWVYAVVDVAWGPESMAWALVAMLVLGAAYLFSPHGLVQAAGAAWSWVLVVEAASLWTATVDGVVAAFLLALVGAGWLGLAEVGAWREPRLARALGGVDLLAASVAVGFGMESASACYVALYLTAAVMIALYLYGSQGAYLVIGVLALTSAVVTSVLDVTHGSIGAGGAVLVAGLTLLAASGAALSLQRRRAVTAGLQP